MKAILAVVAMLLCCPAWACDLTFDQAMARAVSAARDDPNVRWQKFDDGDSRKIVDFINRADPSTPDWLQGGVLVVIDDETSAVWFGVFTDGCETHHMGIPASVWRRLIRDALGQND